METTITDDMPSVEKSRCENLLRNHSQACLEYSEPPSLESSPASFSESLHPNSFEISADLIHILY